MTPEGSPRSTCWETASFNVTRTIQCVARTCAILILIVWCCSLKCVGRTCTVCAIWFARAVELNVEGKTRITTIWCCPLIIISIVVCGDAHGDTALRTILGTASRLHFPACATFINEEESPTFVFYLRLATCRRPSPSSFTLSRRTSRATSVRALAWPRSCKRFSGMETCLLVPSEIWTVPKFPRKNFLEISVCGC